MRKFLWIHCVPLLIILNLHFGANKSLANLDTLRMVHVLWRHGERTPSNLIPSDHENHWRKWKEFGGPGALTGLGIKQLFDLGKLIRQRYEDFLSSHYKLEEIVFRSSNFSRTKMSAMAVWQGIFARKNQFGPILPLEDNIPEHLLKAKEYHNHIWQPWFDDTKCLTAIKAESDLLSSVEFKQIEQQNELLLRLIGQNSGFHEIPYPLSMIYRIQESIEFTFKHQSDSFVPPSWVNETIRKEISRLFHLKHSLTYQWDIHKRLWAGPMFTEFMDHMENAHFMAGGPKFYAYSGHDFSIAGLLAIFGIIPAEFPAFASAVFLELHHQPNNNNFTVRLFYKNGSDMALQPLEYRIPDCSDAYRNPTLLCTLQALRASRARFLIEPREWTKECGL